MEQAKEQAEKEREEKEQAKEREKQANIRLDKAIIKRHEKGEKEEDIAEYFEMSVEDVRKIIAEYKKN